MIVSERCEGVCDNEVAQSSGHLVTSCGLKKLEPSGRHATLLFATRRDIRFSGSAISAEGEGGLIIAKCVKGRRMMTYLEAVPPREIRPRPVLGVVAAWKSVTARLYGRKR